MYTKSCIICNGKYDTKDHRQKTCGDAVCKRTNRTKSPVIRRVQALTPQRKITYVRDLPEPTDLPASYVKRCYDLWCELNGHEVSNTTKRIG